MIDIEEITEVNEDKKRESYERLCQKLDRDILDLEIMISDILKKASSFEGYDFTGRMKKEIKDMV